MQWHVLAGQADGNSYTIAYHIPIPAGNNSAGVSWANALINAGLGGKTVMPTGDGTGSGGTITSTELTQIQSGQLIEVVKTYATNPSQTTQQQTADLNATYTALANAAGPFLQQLANQLKYFGANSGV